METISLFNKSRGKEFKTTLHPGGSKKITYVDFNDVNKLEFSSGISLRSLLWALIFFIFFLDLCLRKKPENWFFSSIVAMSVGFSILLLILANKQYYIVVHLNDGTKTKIEVAKDNKVAAEAFVVLVSSELN